MIRRPSEGPVRTSEHLLMNMIGSPQSRVVWMPCLSCSRVSAIAEALSRGLVVSADERVGGWEGGTKRRRIKKITEGSIP